MAHVFAGRFVKTRFADHSLHEFSQGSRQTSIDAFRHRSPRVIRKAYCRIKRSIRRNYCDKEEVSNGCRCCSLLTEQPQLSHCASANFADFAKISLRLDEVTHRSIRQGWQPIKRLYEDKGESGSHLGRPGLQSLLEDIRLGLVDIVVVHRLDRLTRHLRDLQELVTIFEHHAVALVCVTQSIDTANSHGRLAINLLTSFAQFER
ncbi:MAG: recombinase family protein, partial [Betaproteobacteria bacterium]|nr:recombinase family protein [Betaproteobacteria bacterium]